MMSRDIYLQIMLSSAVLHILNWVFHCSTLTPLLHRTIAFFLTVQQAVTPTWIQELFMMNKEIKFMQIELPNFFPPHTVVR